MSFNPVISTILNKFEKDSNSVCKYVENLYAKLQGQVKGPNWVSPPFDFKTECFREIHCLKLNFLTVFNRACRRFVNVGRFTRVPYMLQPKNFSGASFRDFKTLGRMRAPVREAFSYGILRGILHIHYDSMKYDLMLQWITMNMPYPVWKCLPYGSTHPP